MTQGVLDLPLKLGTYFISHSYKDESARQDLIQRLPNGITPFIFPAINDPSRLVSNYLISSIREKDGIIVIEEGYSSASFWVAFERDYALQIGKPVYSYRPSDRSIREILDPPLDLNIFATYIHREREIVSDVMTILQQERNIKIYDSQNLTLGESFQNAINFGIRSTIEAGGYALVFWSASAASSKFVLSEMDWASQYHNESRLLFALVDETPLDNQLFLKTQTEFALPRVVKLYQEPRLHRIDDIVVRLYWLIYQNTRQNQLV
ncbi:MAG: toll/interleukin-1 receptor domain-containing protein [Anaerolineae bacterium]|nr:toll/interleukin-1 receptor domain-containing protein [Anaerolineae bacterium]